MHFLVILLVSCEIFTLGQKLSTAQTILQGTIAPTALPTQIPTKSINDFQGVDRDIAALRQFCAATNCLENTHFNQTHAWNFDMNANRTAFLHNPCTNESADKWVGVSCSQQRVVSLELQRSNLRGTISDAVASIQYLANLDLNNNELTGTIPSSFNSFGNSITYIQLQYNPSLFGPVRGCALLNSSNFIELDVTDTNVYCYEPCWKNTLNSPNPKLYLDNTVPICTEAPTSQPTAVPSGQPTSRPTSAQRIDMRGLEAFCKSVNCTSNPLFQNKKTTSQYDAWNFTTNRYGVFYHHACEENWYGVSCIDKKVYHLDIREANVKGSLPLELLLLEQLRTLEISDNKLTGTIPEAYTDFGFLGSFFFSNNEFEGSLELCQLASRGVTVDASDSGLGCYSPCWATEANKSASSFEGMIECVPTRAPTSAPSGQPSGQPSGHPSGQPSGQPSARPSGQPSRQPSPAPTFTQKPTVSMKPTSVPTDQPSGIPSGQPSGKPSGTPTGQPSGIPSGQPSGKPTGQPSGKPTGQPSGKPSRHPSVTSEPSGEPTRLPSGKPTGQPSGKPSGEPSGKPSGEPSGKPSGYPSGKPTGHPSSKPSGYPSGKPTGQPSGKPSGHPSAPPSSEPTVSFEPTGQPSTSSPSVTPETTAIASSGNNTGEIVGAVLGVLILSFAAYYFRNNISTYLKKKGMLSAKDSKQEDFDVDAVGQSRSVKARQSDASAKSAKTNAFVDATNDIIPNEIFVQRPAGSTPATDFVRNPLQRTKRSNSIRGGKPAVESPADTSADAGSPAAPAAPATDGTPARTMVQPSGESVSKATATQTEGVVVAHVVQSEDLERKVVATSLSKTQAKAQAEDDTKEKEKANATTADKDTNDVAREPTPAPKTPAEIALKGRRRTLISVAKGKTKEIATPSPRPVKGSKAGDDVPEPFDFL